MKRLLAALLTDWHRDDLYTGFLALIFLALAIHLALARAFGCAAFAAAIALAIPVLPKLGSYRSTSRPVKRRK